MKRSDVAIIGASVAGTTVAHKLEQAGLSCVIVDKSIYPRKKVCGEGLSMLGVHEVAKLGLRESFFDLPSHPFLGFQFHEAGKVEALEIFSTEDGRFHGIGIARDILDGFMVHSLKHSTVHLGTEARIVEQRDGSFIVITGAETYHCPFLVLATGSQSNLPQLLGVPTEEAPYFRTGLSLYVHTPQPAKNYVDIYLGDEFQACWTWTDEHLATVSFMTDRDARIFKASNAEKLLARVEDAVGAHASILDEPLGAAGIGRFFRPYRCRNIFVVGDAIRQLDPIGGMGMTHALIGARITAETLIKMIRGTPLEAGLADKYHIRRMNRSLKFAKGYTQLAYLSLVNPLGKKTLGRLKTNKIARTILASMHSNRRDTGNLIISTLLLLLARL